MPRETTQRQDQAGLGYGGAHTASEVDYYIQSGKAKKLPTALTQSLQQPHIAVAPDPAPPVGIMPSREKHPGTEKIKTRPMGRRKARRKKGRRKVARRRKGES